MSEPKRTPLYEEHVQRGGRIVDFAGWALPVEFAGLRQEHQAVRSGVGLFDVSHMGEVFVRGPKSLETLQWLTSNDVSKLKAGDAQYSLLPNESGGIVDDIIVYCLEPNLNYLVCVNAANIAKDEAWMRGHNRGAQIDNESHLWSQIAVQGPRAADLVADVFGPTVREIPYFKFQTREYAGVTCFVARTGYTGEDGFEIFILNAGAVPLWRSLLEKGQERGVQPIGLGARDTLRTEMKYSLYGHEISDETNPLEAGLGWVVKLTKGPFLGADKIAKVKEAGVTRNLVGYRMLEKGIPREKYALYSSQGQAIGVTTSGTLSPTLNEGIGIGYVEKAYAAEGTEILVDIRGRKVKSKIVKTPFVSPKGS